MKAAQDKTQAALQVQALASAQQSASQSALNAAVMRRTDVDTLISSENLSSARANAARAKADEQLLQENPWLRQLGTAMREVGVTGGNRN